MVKIGDKVVKIQGFSGPDEAIVEAKNIDYFDGLVRAGLMKVVDGDSFRKPEPKPEPKPEVTEAAKDENTIDDTVGDKPRARSRRRNPKSEEG